MSMKFFGGRRMQTRIHLKAPKRNQKGDRKLVILFRIGLNGDTVRSAPDVVKWAFDGVNTKGESHVALKKEIEGINIEAFETDKAKSANLRSLKGLYLQNLVVKEISSGKGDKSIVLTFSAEYEWDEVIWRWLGDHFATDVFLEFDPAQASLLDIPDEKADEEEEEEEQMELGEKESAEAVTNGKTKGKGKPTSFNIEDFNADKKAEKTDAATGTE
jgi:hypothetical protein